MHSKWVKSSEVYSAIIEYARDNFYNSPAEDWIDFPSMFNYIARNFSDEDRRNIDIEAFDKCVSLDVLIGMFMTFEDPEPVDVDIQFDYDKRDWYIRVDDPESENIYLGIHDCTYEQACNYWKDREAERVSGYWRN